MILNTNDEEKTLSKFLDIDEERAKDLAVLNRGYFIKYMVDLIMDGLKEGISEKEYITNGCKAENILLKQIIGNCRNIEEVVFVSMTFTEIIRELLAGSLSTLKTVLQVNKELREEDN